MLKSENLSGLSDNAQARANIGLGNVDNTSDENKIISIATKNYIASRGQNLFTNGTGYLGTNYNMSSITFDSVDTPP